MSDVGHIEKAFDKTIKNLIGEAETNWMTKNSQDLTIYNLNNEN